MFTKKKTCPFYLGFKQRDRSFFYLSISISVTNFGELVKVSATGQVLSINMHNECKKSKASPKERPY